MEKNKKYDKKGRYFNLKMLEDCDTLPDFIYSNHFYKYKVNCLKNNELKLIVILSSDTKYINQYDYHFIKYKNAKQLKDKKFIDEVNKIVIRNKWLLNRAKELNNILHESERWFLDKFKDSKYEKEMNFKSNQIFRSLFIPDLFSMKFKTIIEIDGGYHFTPEQKIKDEKRDKKFIKYNFNVIRVKAYDDASFLNCLNKLDEIYKKGQVFKSASNTKIKSKENERVYIRRKIKVNQKDFKNQIMMIDFKKKMPF